MLKKIAGLMLVAVLVMLAVPTGDAQAQCGCASVCGAGVAAYAACLADGGDVQSCNDDYRSGMETCMECVIGCPQTSCYDGCIPDSLKPDCQDAQDEGACMVAFYSGIVSCMRTCDPCAPEAMGGSRLDQYSFAQPVAIYCTDSGIEVWAIDAEGNGSLLFIAPADGEVPAENQTLAQVDDVILSRLSTGEFQVNALDGEGNPYVLVWDACPANDVYVIK